MSVINYGPKRKDYSDYSSYSYSRIGPKERALNVLSGQVNLLQVNNCSTTDGEIGRRSLVGIKGS